MAILVLDDKLDYFDLMGKKIYLDKNGQAFYPRPLLPPTADGSPLTTMKHKSERIKIVRRVFELKEETEITKSPCNLRSQVWFWVLFQEEQDLTE